jgi:hypothetical protein
MKAFLQLMIAYIAIITQMMIGPVAFAADTSIAGLSLSGNVPMVFSVVARGIPGDLDLTPGVIVNDRLLGIFHFKYNNDIATIVMTSDSATGTPMTGATAYPAAVAFTYKFSAGCTPIKAAGEAAWSIAAGTSIDFTEAAAAQPLLQGHGFEEDCDLTASWGGQTLGIGQLPLAGRYSMTLTLTMVSI